MASGRLFLTASLSLFSCAALPPALHAEDTAASQAESDGKHVFLGEVNANAVYVRSRASEDAYPTMQLKKGDRVIVTGIKGNWLKIVPPEHSFAYIPKSFVNMRGDGTVGRMTREWIARVGSELNELAAEPMSTLHEGEDVEILGQYHEYFKIKPPQGSCLWINKQFVMPIETVKPEPLANGPSEAGTTQTPRETPPDKQIASNDAKAPANEPAGEAGTTPTTRPSNEVAQGDQTSPTAGQPPATQPAKFDAVAEYEKLEKQFADATNKPILGQPLPEMLAGYQKLLDAEDLPSSMRQIAQIRIASLQVRNDAREKFLAVQQGAKQMAEKQQSLLAERQEIEQRIKQNDLQIFAAVGTLRTSSLQIGQGTLYRLTDPATGRTVAYLRTSDPKYAGFLGQFIGVRGTVSSDAQLKSIIENPIEAQAVEPDKVNVSIAAQIVPPSLIKFSVPPAAQRLAPPPAAQAPTASADTPQAAQPANPATPPANTPPSTGGTASTGGNEPQ